MYCRRKPDRYELPSIFVHSGTMLLRCGMGFYRDCTMAAPTKVFISDPCLFGLPDSEILTSAPDGKEPQVAKPGGGF